MSKKPLVTEVQVRLVRGGALKARGSVVLGNNLVRIDCQVVEGKNGLFVSPPRYQGRDGKFYFSAFFIDPDLQKEVTDTVLAKYNSVLNAANSAPAFNQVATNQAALNQVAVQPLTEPHTAYDDEKAESVNDDDYPF